MTRARRTDPPLVPAQAAFGTRGAVVSPHRLASAAGLGVLRAGGSAVDAAIATNAALAVVAAHSCGLGGDAFWLIWDGRAEVGLNGSGRAGAAATIEAAHAAGHGDRLPLRGPWTVTVPGAIRSWGDAHARFGRLPWADLLAPAIELAEGFPASPGWSAAVERSAAIFGVGSDWARVFRAAGRPVARRRTGRHHGPGGHAAEAGRRGPGRGLHGIGRRRERALPRRPWRADQRDGPRRPHVHLDRADPGRLPRRDGRRRIRPTAAAPPPWSCWRSWSASRRRHAAASAGAARPTRPGSTWAWRPPAR